jgi:hypothetical protein
MRQVTIQKPTAIFLPIRSFPPHNTLNAHLCTQHHDTSPLHREIVVCDSISYSFHDFSWHLDISVDHATVGINVVLIQRPHATPQSTMEGSESWGGHSIIFVCVFPLHCPFVRPRLVAFPRHSSCWPQKRVVGVAPL